MRKSFAFSFVRYFQFSKWNYLLGSSQIRDAMRFSILFFAIFSENQCRYDFDLVLRIFECIFVCRLCTVLCCFNSSWNCTPKSLKLHRKMIHWLLKPKSISKKKIDDFMWWNIRREIKIRLNFFIANKMAHK